MRVYCRVLYHSILFSCSESPRASSLGHRAPLEAVLDEMLGMSEAATTTMRDETGENPKASETEQ